MYSIDQCNKALWRAAVELCLGAIKYSEMERVAKKTVRVVLGCKGPQGMGWEVSC